jgi:hypothetical protein
VAVTEEARGSVARVSSPWKRVKWPRTLLTMRWRDGEGHIGVAGVDGVGPGDVAGDLHGSDRHD